MLDDVSPIPLASKVPKLVHPRLTATVLKIEAAFFAVSLVVVADTVELIKLVAKYTKVPETAAVLALRKKDCRNMIIPKIDIPKIQK
jgi:hypothetical protein